MKFNLVLPLLAATCLPLLAIDSYAQDAPKKEVLAGQLLDVLNIKKMYEGAFARIPKMQEQMMGSQKMSPDEKARFDKQMQSTMEAVKTAIDWNTIKPIFTKIYADNFDETELNGLIAFYKTPVGQTWIQKQPEIQAATMQAMGQIMPKIQAAVLKSTAQTSYGAKTEIEPKPTAAASPTP